MRTASLLTNHLATRLLSGVDAHFLLSRRKYFLHETAHNKVCGQDFWKETLLLSFSNLFFGTLEKCHLLLEERQLNSASRSNQKNL